jgi:hypothetical protein
MTDHFLEEGLARVSSGEPLERFGALGPGPRRWRAIEAHNLPATRAQSATSAKTFRAMASKPEMNAVTRHVFAVGRVRKGQAARDGYKSNDPRLHGRGFVIYWSAPPCLPPLLLPTPVPLLYTPSLPASPLQRPARLRFSTSSRHSALPTTRHGALPAAHRSALPRRRLLAAR